MEEIKCPYCDQLLGGYTKVQVEYMLHQHILARHKDKMYIKNKEGKLVSLNKKEEEKSKNK